MNNTKQTQDDRTIQPFNCSTIQRVKAYAFTLAETLIVIGIIGVVAALTLPNLNHATGDKEKVTKVKKIYSSLTDAFDRAQVIYGDADTWVLDGSACAEALEECIAKRVTEFMKVSKICGYESGCWSDSEISFPAGDVEDSPGHVGYSVLLSDGMALTFVDHWPMERIIVDIDGPNKGKKQIGNDIFEFDFVTEPFGNFKVNELSPGYDPSRDSEEDTYIYFNTYATAWVIENGNMEYLKADEDGVCPNGTQLSWTVTSCN